MLALKLAFKNLLGAGLRTWLNVSVLSVAFVLMVFYNGMLDGWNMQAVNDSVAWEVGNGQYWHANYDPYDALTFQDAHSTIEKDAQQLIHQGDVTPILIAPASAYPQNRQINIHLKGIDTAQAILSIPSQHLNSTDGETNAMIGYRMAKAAHLSKGDRLLVRWRDANGTFDAREVTIAHIFKSNVPTIDNGTIWISLHQLQNMTGLQNQATLLVAGANHQPKPLSPWQFKSVDELLKDFKIIMKQKKAGSSIIYGLLMAIALLAIFDTQVLSIFKRQREIGTYIAMGMTRAQVIRIFTIEGAAHSLLALLLAAVYGTPLLVWLHFNGIPMPQMVEETGIVIADSIMPVYSIGMLTASIALVVFSATIVSYFPAHRISKLNATDALKGKIR